MTFVEVKIPLRKQFGLRVKELRKATGLSQEAFADRCGFVRSYMSRIERGKANPSLDAVQDLADALGVEVIKLFVLDGEPTASSVALKCRSLGMAPTSARRSTDRRPRNTMSATKAQATPSASKALTKRWPTSVHSERPKSR